jgi:hypothetical protein
MRVEFCVALICLELHLNKKKRTVGAIIADTFKVCVVISADIPG